ncbi:MAG: hypothetical protein K2W99_01020 [Chthoniobacterales bacterium]|nr:hypothetical protein [Chthoniobacterales bacterium]
MTKFLFKFFLTTLSLSVFFLFSETLQAQAQPEESTQALIPGPDQQQSAFLYQGFTIDETKIENRDDLPSAREAIEKQIDLILNLNLPLEIVTFFKKVPIYFVRKSASSPRGNYDSKSHIISLNIAPFVTGSIAEWWYDVDRNTTLLDQLLHVYYNDVLAQDPNKPIDTFFKNAKKNHLYYALLEKFPKVDEDRFFAHTAKTYLCNWSYNSWPYRRQEIQDAQPDYYQYLEQLFGPAHYSLQ